MKVTMYHYWDAKSKKHEGVSTSISCDVSSGGDFIHQAFELNVPECPGPLTNSEKLEKLVELSSLFFKHADYGYSAAEYSRTRDELKALIKEYSK